MKITQIKSKIEKVFEALDKQKIKGEQDFWCCQTCGSNAMLDYSKDYEGFVFYHNQDTDTLKSENYTYLSYGNFGDASATDIAHRIVKAFQDEGIKVTWDGNINTRILIEFGVVI